MCVLGDMEEGEICETASEDIYVYKPGWVRIPVMNARIGIEMRVKKGDHYHIRLGRQPLQGRARSVTTTRFLNADGSVNDTVQVCGTDQHPRNDGSILYIPGCTTEMDVASARIRLRSPHYPGIHFRFFFEDILESMSHV
jgi:hypothetical protein